MEKTKQRFILENIYDVLANNSRFYTSEDFAQEHDLEIDYDKCEITITDDETGEFMTLCVK